MLDSSDQQRLHKLLSDTIPLLCKRTLGYSLELSVEAFIGITLSGENASKEMVMVSFKETILADGRASKYVWSEVPSSSTGFPPSLAEPVAFNIAESGRDCPTSLPVAASIDDNYNELERQDEYDPDWDDGKYWAECNKTVIDNGASQMLRDSDKIATAASASACLPSFPVKMEENDDVVTVGDDSDEHEEFLFIADEDLENASNNNSYKNQYTSVVPRYSSAPCPRRNTITDQHYPSTASQILPKSTRGSRKIINQRCSMQPRSFQHLPPSSCSKPDAQMKKSPFPVLNTILQSSRPEVSKGI